MKKLILAACVMLLGSSAIPRQTEIKSDFTDEIDHIDSAVNKVRQRAETINQLIK